MVFVVSLCDNIILYRPMTFFFIEAKNRQNIVLQMQLLIIL